MSFNLNANINFNKTCVQLKRCNHTGVTLSRYHACEPCIPYSIHISVCPRFKFGFLCPMFWQIISFSVNMVPRGISEVQILQILTMRSTWISLKANGRKMGYHDPVVSRFVRKHTQTNTVKDLLRYGRQHVTSQSEDRALHRLIRWMPFANNPVLRRQWLPNRHLSERTVRNCLNQHYWSQGE